MRRTRIRWTQAEIAGLICANCLGSLRPIGRQVRSEKHRRTSVGYALVSQPPAAEERSPAKLSSFPCVLIFGD